MAANPQYIRIPNVPSVRISPDRAVTADITTNAITLAAHGFAAGNEVRFVSGTVPTGLVLNTTYFVINPTTNDFQLAATLGGSLIDLTVSNGANIVLRTQNQRTDGLGNLTQFYTHPLAPGAEGSRIDLLRIKAVGVTTAGMIRFYKFDGTSYRLLEEVAVTAATPSGTVQAFKADLPFSGGLLLLPGQSIWAASHNAEQFDITALQAGDF
jgi:preprotein translocase subunit Sec61beta